MRDLLLLCRGPEHTRVKTAALVVMMVIITVIITVGITEYTSIITQVKQQIQAGLQIKTSEPTTQTTETKENLIRKAYEESDNPFGHLLESEKRKLVNRYNSLSSKIECGFRSPSDTSITYL